MARQSHVGLKLESSYGTPVAGDYTHFSEAENETVELNRTYTDISVQRSAVLVAKEEVQRRVVGDLTLNANYQDLAPWLKLHVGSALTSGTTDKTHLFPDPTPGIVDTEGVSATVEIARDDAGDGANTWRYAGIKVPSIALVGNLTDVVAATIGVMGKSESLGDISSVVAFKDADFMLQKHAYLSLDGGTTKLLMQSHNIRSEWTKDEPFAHQGASPEPEELNVEPRQTDVMRVAGDCTVLFEDATLTEYGFVGDGLLHDVVLFFEKSAVISLKLQLAEAVVVSGTPHKDGRGRRIATFAFEAVATDPVWTLKNQDAGSPW